MYISKLSIILISALLLNGCFKVEDDSNDEVVAALQAQNQILIDQNQNQDASVSVRGQIKNFLTDNQVAEATIRITSGSNVYVENMTVSGGRFEIAGLPERSDIEFLISSSTNEFLPRVYFFNTGVAVTAPAQKDLGTFLVSVGKQAKITVINGTTNEILPNLVFKAFSHSQNYNDPTNSSADDFAHISTFDAATGEYSIIVPEGLVTSVRAKLDVDGDGDSDFIPEDFRMQIGEDLFVDLDGFSESETIFVQEVSAAIFDEIEFRISIVDLALSSLENAKVIVDDQNNDDVVSAYDSVFEQHVLTIMFDSSIDLEIPAFSEGDVDYQSSSLRISENGNGTLSVSGTNIQGNRFYTINATDTIDLAFTPSIDLQSPSQLEVVLASQDLDPVDSSYSVFYSMPIEVAPENVSLTNIDQFVVTRGNDDPNDLIQPGVTSIEEGASVPVTASTSLNDSKLKLTPDQALIEGDQYRFEIGTLTIKGANQQTNLSNDGATITVAESTVLNFDINDVRLDNANFTTNGIVITSANTAGIIEAPFNRAGFVRLILPNSIENLQNFTMNQTFFTRNGSTIVTARSYVVVSNGLLRAQRVGIIRVARNEVVTPRSNKYLLGSAQAESAKSYSFTTNEFLQDNVIDLLNSITFSYSYETKSGEVQNGTLTLPVM